MIFLMRHSIATRGDFSVPDDGRWLTKEGRDLANEAAAALQAHLQRTMQTIDFIASSPCVRAVQTAEIVSRQLQWTEAIPSMQAVRSESSPQQAIEEIAALPFLNGLIVCHEPIVSSMSVLLSGQTPTSHRSGFRTAEIRSFAEGGANWLWRG